LAKRRANRKNAGGVGGTNLLHIEDCLFPYRKDRRIKEKLTGKDRGVFARFPSWEKREPTTGKERVPKESVTRLL